MILQDKLIEEYVIENSTPLDDVLQELERETHIKVLRPRMLSGRIQGKFLEFIVKLSGAKRILEIGTYTGYSAICMANALSNDGKIHTIDINVELENIVRKYISKSNNESKIDYYIGDAIEIIPTIKEDFDLVFIDADKTNYWNYFSMLIDDLKSGAWIVADNVLWSGKVLEEAHHNDKETIALKSFNKKIQEDKRVENLLLPLRDGLMIMRKI
jgi:caffeoyl-CoA O-methyltransferase